MNALERLRGRLVVSVQAAAGSALDDASVIAAMAAAALEGGAAGLRVQGVANLRAVRARVGSQVPLIGLIKRSYAGFEPYITPTPADVRHVVESGADIVAFDATGSPHPDGATPASLVDEIHRGGALAMADCAAADDGIRSAGAGADIIATTLCGYTAATRGAPLPGLPLLAQWRELDVFRVCEGGLHSPQSAAAALEAGAHAVVVGTAITAVPWLTGRFADALKPKSSRA